ncbi:MAG: DUF6483 family protein [Dorea sp.]|uniref:DUF6483 family protein n=1 Tax=Dorea sp. YH-dor226 TaxID=3151119 RepID=UPI00302FF157|nr:DUF6483 family protein [Dorea sp.]
MQYEDEQDYIMRMIKESVRVLASLILGKKYVQVTLPPENKYQVSGSKEPEWKELTDNGHINEAENSLLEKIDYQNQADVEEALLFYEYVSRKGNDFLKQCNYSEEEVLEGLKNLARRSGYAGILEMIE